MPDILQDLLPPDFKLAVDTETRTLSLLCISSSSIVVQQLTKNEYLLLMIFEEHHPHYAPNELLLASITSLSPHMCRRRIYEAQEKGTNAVTRELKPVYRALSTLRKKLKSVYQPLDISLLRGVGYVLRVARDVNGETEQEGK